MISQFNNKPLPLAFSIYSLLVILNLSFVNLVFAEVENKGKAKQTDNYFSVVSKNGIMRWPDAVMPLQVYIKSGDTTDGYRPIFTTLLEQAFSEWSIGSQNRVRFALTNDPNKAQIICGWTSDKNDMTKLTEGGHAVIVPEGHTIKRVEISILTKSVDNEKITDQFFKRVALHEIGHTLGLTDHSPDPDDIMYGCAPSLTTNCSLSDRDKSTIIALYSLNDSTVEHSSINIANLLPAKNNNSNLARVIRLNAEASNAMQSKNLSLAVSKLEEAHQIDPNNDLVNSNLGAAYANCAVASALIKDNQRAQVYFNKAIPLLAKSPNQENYLSILKYYERFLRSTNQVVEADKINKKVEAVSKR